MKAQRSCACDVLMIRPASFCANEETAPSNSFQRIQASDAHANVRAQAEFDGLVDALRASRVRVHIVEDSPVPRTPDALFPNNWVTFHDDGTVVLYPMLALNRRLERRRDVVNSLASSFHIQRILDFSPNEQHGRFLEGTGSLVLDRKNRIAYACLSPRTHPDVVREFAEALGYEMVLFEATDAAGAPVYHTNVVMSVGERFAVICTDAIHPQQRAKVLAALRRTTREIVQITRAQMSAFLGNVLELATSDGRRVIAMSTTAEQSLTAHQRALLQAQSGNFVTAAIPTIESLGGGSVRCMLAEIFLPSAPV